MLKDTKEYNVKQEDLKTVFKISRWLAKDISDCLEPDEYRSLEQWLLQSDSHREIYERIKKDSFSNMNNQYYSCNYINTELARLYKKIEKPNKMQSISALFKYAAILILFLGSVLLLKFYIFQSNSSESEHIIPYSMDVPILSLSTGQKVKLTSKYNKVLNEEDGKAILIDSMKISYKDSCTAVSKSIREVYNKLYVPKGVFYQLELADGTQVSLNSQTEISYPTQFKENQRVVYLKGEAYFDVAHDSLRPFIVKTVNDVDVKVLGTKFNVSSYSDLSEILTTLVEGSVEVFTPIGNRKLNPDEQCIFNKETKTIQTREVNSRLYVLWKSEMYGFSEESLGTILYKLSLWYDVDFVFEDNSLTNKHFTGIFRKEDSIVTILNALQNTLSVKFILKGDKIIVSK